MNKQNYKNSQSKFPLSTDSMDFMQEQLIMVGKALASTTNSRYMIIDQPGSSGDGLCIFNGEVMPLKEGSGYPYEYISVVTEYQSVTAKGVTYNNVREVRYAKFDTSGVSVEKFTYPSYQCTLPKGSIIMWAGEIAHQEDIMVPVGYVPCGDLPSADAISAFEAFFSAMGVSYTKGGYGFTKVNGVNVPNMSGAIPIGVGESYEQTTIGLGRQTKRADISASGTDYVYGVYYLIKYM